MRGKKALKNIISNLLLQSITVISGFVLPSLIIRTYGSSVNGIVTSITQFLAYITLLESGIGPVIKATLYKPIANKDKQDIENILKSSEKFFRIISYIFIIYIVVLCVFFPMLVNEEFDFWFTLSLIIIISVATFFEYYFGMTYRLYLQANQSSYVVYNIQIVTTAINMLLTIVLIRCSATIQTVKLVSALVFIFRPIIQNIYVKKKYKINLKNANKEYKLKQKWDGLAQHIASVIHHNTDVTILTIFCNVKEVSVYSVYILVTNGIKKIVEALVNGVGALFGDMIAKNEKNLLRKYFKMYELIYFTIITFIFLCAAILIVPFVQVYTMGITDVNYYRPIFAYIIVIAEFICMIRLPYINISYAAGHFKETRKGAWVEAISNILVSLVLVWKLGIVGVAIGTLIAMIIRTIEFMYHTNKYILERRQSISFTKIGVIIIEGLVIIGISKLLPVFEINSYFSWFIYACIIAFISILVIVPFNLIIYKEDTKNLLNMIKNNIKKKELSHE